MDSAQLSTLHAQLRERLAVGPATSRSFAPELADRKPARTLAELHAALTARVALLTEADECAEGPGTVLARKRADRDFAMVAAMNDRKLQRSLGLAKRPTSKRVQSD